MIAIYLMLPVSLLLALIFLIAYVWSIRTGQYEDMHTPSLRILTEDAGGSGMKSMSPRHTAQTNS